jgi:hypothetical protein
VYLLTAAQAAEWLDEMDRNALTYLSELNRSMDAVFTMLDKLNEYPELQKDYFVVLKAILREQLANINTSAMSALEESEQKELFVAYTQRMVYEKEIRDPDDRYLMVLEREKELQRQGQPSRIRLGSIATDFEGAWAPKWAQRQVRVATPFTRRNMRQGSRVRTRIESPARDQVCHLVDLLLEPMSIRGWSQTPMLLAATPDC